MNTVEKIHAAFDEAQEFLLVEAEKFEEKKAVSDKEIEYLKSMKKLGFVNADKVKEIETRKEEIAKSKKLTELVLYYKRTYPFLKFLTVKQLENICEKYNLIYAPVENYTGTVPEKNLKEIMNAQELREEDEAKNQVVSSRGQGRVRTETTLKNGLFIAAPESDFDLKDLKKEKGIRGYFKTILEEKPDDPIVFRYVFGGIQVLSKWGPEAEDPELTNALDN